MLCMCIERVEVSPSVYMSIEWHKSKRNLGREHGHIYIYMRFFRLIMKNSLTDMQAEMWTIGTRFSNSTPMFNVRVCFRIYCLLIKYYFSGIVIFFNGIFTVLPALTKVPHILAYGLNIRYMHKNKITEIRIKL